MVDQATYAVWEAEVINMFYSNHKEQSTLIPTDEKPSALSKEKYILVADACAAQGGCLSDMVGAGTTADLPEYQYLQLWHCGMQKKDGVRFGLARDGVFKHPACDLGGLTNLRQKLGKTVTFAGISTPWGPEAGDTAETVAQQVVAQWQQLTGKELTGMKLEENVAEFVGTVKEGAPVLSDARAPAATRQLLQGRRDRDSSGDTFSLPNHSPIMHDPKPTQQWAL